MKSVTISQMRANEEVEGFFLIRSIQIKTTNQNKKYLDLTLADKTGEINAKKWECKKEDEERYQIGSVIKARGQVSEWQNKLQLKIFLMRLTEKDDDIVIQNLVPAAPESGETMFNYIFDKVSNFEDEELKKLVIYILEDKRMKLLYYPAAKSNHHAILSGLLYHILRMLEVGEKLSKIYNNINRELLLSGIILHDIQKTEELNANELGIVSAYTIEGTLLGHIIMGIKYIEEIGKKLEISQEKIMLLEHMLLSHHYEPEYGSPVKPMIPEGELLHYIDMIDARMYDMDKHLKEVEEGTFSEQIFSLDRRRLYKAKIKEEK
jgi:3'-5' exoribonuclease